MSRVFPFLACELKDVDGRDESGMTVESGEFFAVNNDIVVPC
jgi:hypothetical protein